MRPLRRRSRRGGRASTIGVVRCCWPALGAMLVHEYCDATRWVLHLGQRDVGIQTGRGVVIQGKR